VKQWWIGLSRRERIAVIAASALVAAALLYLLGSSRPGARAHGSPRSCRACAPSGRADALAAEAKTLRCARARPNRRRRPKPRSPSCWPSAASLRAPSATTASAGSCPRGAADAAAWLSWLQEAASELSLRVSAARVSRVAPGVVDAEVTLAPVGQR